MSYVWKEGNMNQDTVLIKEILAGKEHSFRFLIEKYKKLVFSVSYNVLKDYQESENITQETFMQLYISLKKGTDIDSIKNWLSKVALNKSINLKKKLSRTLCHEDIEPLIENFSNVRSEDDFDLLSENVDKLPEKYKKVVKMYYLERKSYQDIGKTLDISTRTVETRLYRAKKILREEWSEVYHE
jgi:RNA polymerase sigma-70 factor (ECF subfamily)